MSQPLTHVTNYTDATALVMSQYQDSARLKALLTVFLDACQACEDGMFPLLSGRLLTGDAAGQTLDNIGSLVGIARNGLDDVTYRALIYGKIAENYGTGTLQSLESILAGLFEAQGVFIKSPIHCRTGALPRGAFLSIMLGSPQVPTRLFPLLIRLVTQSLPGGVELAHLGTFNAAGAISAQGPQAWSGVLGDTQDSAKGSPLADLLYTNPD